MSLNNIKSQFPIFAKKINGKPLIDYTIQSAIKSKIFTDIVVSTDSKKISSISMYEILSL